MIARLWLFLSLLSIVIAPVKSFAAGKPETPHLAFVTEYIRELAANEETRASAEKELTGAKDNNSRFLGVVHASTLIQLELRSEIGMLNDMKLTAPFGELIPSIVTFYREEIDLHQKLIDISSAFVAGPKPGVDYGDLATEMPKVRASIDYVNKALLEISPLVFATLIDPKPDSKNHLSHLVITKTERDAALTALNNDFGEKLDQKNPSTFVGAASILRTYFRKDFKCSDEPWE